MARESQLATQDAAAADATDPGANDSAPQRGATRAPIRRPVRLQFDDAIDVVEARCHNISIGGMFVHSSEARPVGGLVRFELVLEDESSIRGLAEVVWMRSQDHGPERVAGMGLKFRFLEQRDRQLIFKLVSQHIKERLAARHPGLSDEAAEEEDDQPPPIRAVASTMDRVQKAPAEKLSSIAEYDGSEAGSDEGAESVTDDGSDAGADTDAEGQKRRFGGAPPASSAQSRGDAPSVDSFDSGGNPSGAWLQDGFGGERSAVDMTLGGRESYDEAPAYASLDEEPDYESHLYDDEDHFEHRPKPRRDVPVLAIVAVLVTALTVGAYLFGDRWFGGDSEEPTVASRTAEPAAGTADASASESAESRSAASQADTAAEEPLAPSTDLDAPDGEADGVADDRPRVVDTGLPFVPAQPAPASPAPRRPAAESSTDASSGGDRRPFRTVRDISARVAGPAVEIVITTDGSVSADRFSHARIAGGAPRELIRLRGLSTRFETESIPVGIGAVRQVRTGWHRKSSGNELHVVVDLSSPTAKITAVRVEGRRIIATIVG